MSATEDDGGLLTKELKPYRVKFVRTQQCEIVLYAESPEDIRERVIEYQNRAEVIKTSINDPEDWDIKERVLW